MKKYYVIRLSKKQEMWEANAMSFLNYSNKMRKIVIIVLCIFIFVTAVNAQENVLNLVLIKDENGIRVMDRIVSTSKIESQSTGLADYKLVVKDFDNNIIETINFGFKDNIAVLSVLVSQNFIKGEIYDGDNLILEADLYSHIDVGLCGDSACSGDESYESCPQDCFLQRESLSLEQEGERESKLPFVILYSAISIVTIFIIVFSIILLKKKIKPKEKFIDVEEKEVAYEPRSLEKQLQNYIQQAKKQGLTDEDIKNDLLQTGWPIDLIEKNLK